MRRSPRILRRWMTLCFALSLLVTSALPSLAAPGDGSDSAPLMTCMPLTAWPEGQALKSPLSQGNVQFHAETLMAGNLDGAGTVELAWTGQMKIFLPDVTTVKLSVVHYGQPVTVAAFDGADLELARSTTVAAEGIANTIEWTVPTGIRKVMLYPGEGRYGLSSLCYTLPKNVTGGQPDLVAELDAPGRAKQGQSIDVSLSVRNMGSAVAPGSSTAGDKGYRAELVLSKSGRVSVQPAQATAEYRDGMMLRRVAPTSDVAGGQASSYKASVQIPADTPPGIYYIAAVVDPHQVVTEADELNNVTLKAIIIEDKDAAGLASEGLTWADFSAEKMGPRPEQFTLQQTEFRITGGSKVIDLNTDSRSELLINKRLEITLPETTRVTAQVTHYGSHLQMDALRGGKVIGTKKTTGAPGAVESLTIEYEAIDSLIFTIPAGSQGGLTRLGYLGDGGDLACDPRVSSLAAGYGHSVAVLRDGSVWSWGLSTFGQLGNDTQRSQYEPVQVLGLRNALAVAAGKEHSLALLADGTVWAWGSNNGMQLGDKTTLDRWTPVQVLDLTDVTAIAAGHRFSLALKADGTVWAWGDNSMGQLGDGTNDPRSKPVQVKGLTGVKSIAAGATFAFAIKQDGSLWAWGANQHGQLGDGTNANRNTPAQIRGISEVQQVAASLDHTLALKRDGSVWAWGKNDHGQLGDGTNNARSTPRQVPGIATAYALGSGDALSFAIRHDGTVLGWGTNLAKQISPDDAAHHTSPVAVKGLANILKLSAGFGSHVLSLDAEGRLRAWGGNTHGQTANLFSISMIGSPTPVALKSGLLFCPAKPAATVVEEKKEEQSPAATWACTAPAFKDVPANHPACGAIRMLVDAGVVNGYDDNTFKPSDPITRAAMAKLLVAALKLKAQPNEKVIFSDTNGHWAVSQGWLQTAVKYNIVGGYPDKTFRPDVEVTRSAALRMAAGSLSIPRADGKPIPTLLPPPNPATAHLKDVAQDTWYYEWVVLSLRGNLIGPAAPFPIFTETKFDSERVLNRGEAAIIVANLLLFREK